MVTSSGVRGVFGEGLTTEVVRSFAQSYGLYCRSGRVVVGRDSRISGPALHAAVTTGLTSVGCDVADLGIVPTPTTKIATQKMSADGGIVITASHNPQEWNGLKMLSEDGLFLDEEQGSQVLQIYNSPNRITEPARSPGKVTTDRKSVV